MEKIKKKDQKALKKLLNNEKELKRLCKPENTLELWGSIGRCFK